MSESKCECIVCTECRGTGHVYFDAFTGEYLGPTDWEGWNWMEPCEFCDGTGIEYECYHCQEAMVDDTITG